MEHIPKEKKRAKNRRACPLPGDESQLPVHYSAGEPRLEIIGDLPIYVPYDSCDVWANPSLFQLDETGLPTGVAGCPPDYFSADGQLWGNPLYDWERMRQTDYAWWKERIAAAARLFDVIRIDHFRGLESYWAIPYGDKTARGGKWVKGPGHDFVRAMQERFPDLRLIAEDLGFLTDDVIRLQKDSGWPGMKVLEFAFDSREPSNYLPHRYIRNCICYSGTHDNETLAQWLAQTSETARAYAAEYLGLTEQEGYAWGILRSGLASVADTFIAQLQDYLGLGAEARMNTPGTVGDFNWTWRMDADADLAALAPQIVPRAGISENLPPFGSSAQCCIKAFTAADAPRWSSRRRNRPWPACRRSCRWNRRAGSSRLPRHRAIRRAPGPPHRA